MQVVSAYGMRVGWDPSLRVPGNWASVEGPAELVCSLANAVELRDGFSGEPTPGWSASIEGQLFTCVRGQAGDYLFTHREHVHLLSADLRQLKAGPGRREDLGWWPQFLDSVLYTAALIHGRVAFHAGSVCLAGRAVLVSGLSGVGKSSTLAALLHAGGSLIADDITVVTDAYPGPCAWPGPPLMRLAGNEPPVPGEKEILAFSDDERWVGVPAHEAAPLGAFVTLTRGPAPLTTIEPEAYGPRVLLSSALNFPADRPASERRFDLITAIARRCPAWRVTIGSQSPVGDTVTKMLKILQSGWRGDTTDDRPETRFV